MASFHQEQQLWASGFQFIAGIDEAGRGPLAGPVTVAAVILPADFHCDLVDDSKALSEAEREYCFPIIQEQALAYAIVHGPVGLIEKVNILNATKRAMLQAVKKLAVKPDFLLLDAVNITCPGIAQKSIVGGDAISKSIAAASILAKVSRDRLMTKLDRQFPQYGFAKHKGYATAMHISALRQFGPCTQHRLSFLRFLDDGNTDHTSPGA